MTTRHSMEAISPRTGSALRDFTTNAARSAAAVNLMIDLYVPTERQEALIDQVDSFARGCAGKRGVPLPGRALSAVSQAGKSSMVSELKRRSNAASPANPYRVVHIDLRERITLKMLYQLILHEIGDPEAYGRYSIELLSQRCAELLPARGTHLLAIDEVQLIGAPTNNNYEVADGLKGFLNAGTVPVLFLGNENAMEIFNVNPQFRGRLGVPLRLKPSNPRLGADWRAFRKFAKALDQAIAASGLVKPASLHQQPILWRLGRASGGHIGRFSRIVGAALEHACARGATQIETFDLSYAVAHLAVDSGWTAKNPFPEPAEW